MPTRTRNYDVNALMPIHSVHLATKRAVRLPVGCTILKGKVLGQVTSAAAQSEIRLLTITGTPTGFTGSISFAHGGGTTTATLGNLVTTIPTAAEMQTAFDTIFGTGNTLVTKSSLVYTITFQNMLANVRVASGATGDGLTGSFTFTAGTTPAGTFSISQKGSSGDGQYDVYDDAASDGTQTAKCILIHDYYSDQYGGKVTEVGPGGQPFSPVAYFSGYFRCGDLLGLDANAVTDLGKLSEGTLYSRSESILKF